MPRARHPYAATIVASASLAFGSLLASSPAARAQQPAETKEDFASVAALADDQTVAVVEVNLDGVDVDAAAKWVSDAAGRSGQPADVIAEARQSIDGGAAAAKQFLGGLTAAKAHRMYWLFSLTDPPAQGGAGPGLMVVPLAGRATDAAAVTMVLERVSAKTATIGGAVVAGSAARVEQAQARAGGANAAVVDRTAVEEAFTSAASDNAAIRVALVASADLRKVFEQQMPDLPPPLGGGRTETITRGVRWASLGIALPPDGKARLVVRTNDADAALRVGEQVAAAVRVLREDRGARAAMGDRVMDDVARALVAVVERDRVIVSVDQKAFDRFVPAFAVGVRQQRAAARRSVAMSNARQILLGSVMYANDKQGAFPPQENWHEVVAKSQEMTLAPFGNPRLPGRMPGFVYVRPAAGMKTPAPAETVVLYEPLDSDEPDVIVGYLDGHAEVMSKADFNKKVKPKLPAPAR